MHQIFRKFWLYIVASGIPGLLSYCADVRRYGKEGVQAASQGGEEDFGSFQHAEDIFREFFGGGNPFEAFEEAL